MYNNLKTLLKIMRTYFCPKNLAFVHPDVCATPTLASRLASNLILRWILKNIKKT